MMNEMKAYVDRKNEETLNFVIRSFQTIASKLEV